MSLPAVADRHRPWLEIDAGLAVGDTVVLEGRYGTFSLMQKYPPGEEWDCIGFADPIDGEWMAPED